jgi:FtsZ-binding cell division protein ZapB
MMALPVTADELRKRHTLAGVDPDLKVPAQIKAQALRSSTIQQELLGESEPPVIPPNGTAPPEGTVAPPAVPSQEAGPPQDQQPSPPAAGSSGDEVVSPEEWEKRYRAMKGRYDGLRGEVGQMSEQLQRLQSENASMRVTSTGPQSTTLNLLTEEEVQEYGPEFVDVIRRAAAEVAGPLQTEIQNLRQQLGSVQQETSNAFLTRMNATISGMVNGWQELNRHPAFVEWTQLPDVFSGVIRQQLMQEAWNNGDAIRVAAFFRAFLNEQAAVDPVGSVPRGDVAPPINPSPIPSPMGGTVPIRTSLSLDALAAPGRGQSGAQSPTGKPVYTAADITRFYTDCAAGKWRTREAERAAIDADIIAAQTEGRVIADRRTMINMGDVRGNR